ncbi:MAG: hypothetical protein C0498_01475 [Anaerolinea sp.]|nr:hypothetical protein [Anaerolinea sp.]
MSILATYNGFTGDQRMRAYNWLKREYVAGRRARPVRCQACGQTAGQIMAHSEDYSAPYGPHIGAFELCFRCHMVIHCRFSGARTFWRYVEWLEAGWTVAPAWKGFADVRQMLWHPDAPPPPGSLQHSVPPGDPGILRRIAAGEFAPSHRPTPPPPTFRQGTLEF